MIKADKSHWVYIVDDDPAIRDSLQVFIECMTLDLKVKLFSSASQFFEYIGTAELPRSECLIADERMPGIGGHELIKILKSQNRNIPFVMITGHASNLQREEARLLGASAFLEKPFNPTLLEQAIYNMLKLPEDSHDAAAH